MKTYWERFLRWLDGKNATKDEKVAVSFPKGNTDILLSFNQRRNLENAMTRPGEKNSAGFYSGDTGFWKRGSAGSGRKDDLIL